MDFLIDNNIEFSPTTNKLMKSSIEYEAIIKINDINTSEILNPLN